MTDCVPTCSEYSIDVPAPKDAENRKVPLDTKVMYDASGNEFEVRWLTYSTGPYGQGWSVKAYDRSDGDSSDDRGYTLPLDSLNIEKPDSLKQLAEDLNRIQTKHEADGSLYRELACCYVGRLGATSMCNGCRLNCGDKRCFEAMMEDITNRVNRLCGDAE